MLRGYTLTISFGKSDNPDDRQAGVLILTNNKLVSVKKTNVCKPGLVRITITWGGKEMSVASVYAPAKPLQRVEFFNTTIRNGLTTKTFAGGDWNCVPDVTLDVQGANPLAYHASNQGASLLDHLMSTKHMLSDTRREQLGMSPEHTHSHKVTHGPNSGTFTDTRIDRWYNMEDPTLLYDFQTVNSFIYKKHNSDHHGVLMLISDRSGEMGRERTTLRADLMENRSIQKEVRTAADKVWTQNRNKSYSKRWTLVNDKIYDILLRETKKRRHQELKLIKRKEAILTLIRCRKRAAGTTQRLTDREAQVTKEIYDLRNPEMVKEPSESMATRIWERSDASSKAMFQPYKASAMQQWVNEMYEEDWEEGRKPDFETRPNNAEKVTDVQKVGQEFVKLYKMIYAEKILTEQGRQDAHKILNLMSKKRILKLSQESMDRAIMEEETTLVMEGLPTGKQAGPNRIPNEVYKYLPSFFAPKLTQVINEATRKGKLPKHFLEGDISMMYKKGDRCDPRNYRPITLLNTDYKIFTRILASRMKTVVHEFVSECQKGFVPEVFIAEATALLKLVEAYTNEDGEQRKGIMLFLDMEKAFDRVSYDFTLSGLKSLGFGKRFRGWIKMMYDVKNAPRRRMFVNGYYSDEFQIKSGVAQGCPLSPLLFLVVAEGLRVSLDMETGFKGIKIGNSYYKLSQFADDTTVLMGDKKEIKYVNRAIQRWCGATGMRENIAKREGLGMGKYRNVELRHGIKWTKDGNWCKSLGVPIGNNLDEGKWWQGKINSTRNKTSLWVGLKRATYFGRNLITQAMYFGRLRYWLYSIRMSKAITEVVQKDADVLWWAREPTLEEEMSRAGAEAWDKCSTTQGDLIEKNKKRIRRWVAECTAIGPRNMGGLGVMSWEEHIKAIKAQWIVRYLQPGDSAWKNVLDEFILKSTRGGKLQYPEGRPIVAMGLTVAQKRAILKRIPTKAVYWKECLLAFWNLKLDRQVVGWEGIDGESPWHGPRTECVRKGVSYHDVQYYKNTLGILQMSDFINAKTDELFTEDRWKRWIDHFERRDSGGIPPDNMDIDRIARKIHDISLKIPGLAFLEMTRGQEVDITPGSRIYLERGGHRTPAIVIDDNLARAVDIDAVGRHHERKKLMRFRRYRVRSAVLWGSRWAGPSGSTDAWASEYPFKLRNSEAFTLYDLSRSQEGEYGIKTITREIAKAKMKTPACEAAWERKLARRIRFDKVWRIKADYVSPRDQVAWLKIQHRNLWVAASGGMHGSTECSAAGCNEEEKQEHLVRCSVIRKDFWDKIAALMGRLKMSAGSSDLKWLLGIKEDGTKVDKEEAAMIFWAWRNLYAEVTRARIEGKQLDLETAYKNFVRMTFTRIVAYGAKWYRWFSRQRYKARAKAIPIRFRERKLITSEATAEYSLAAPLQLEYKRLWPTTGPP